MREEQSNMWKLKRGNESESGESIKTEIGMVHVTIGSISSLHLLCMGWDWTWPSIGTHLALVIYKFATLTHISWFGNNEIVFPFFITLTQFFELWVMESEKPKQSKQALIVWVSSNSKVGDEWWELGKPNMTLFISVSILLSPLPFSLSSLLLLSSSMLSHYRWQLFSP